MNAVSGQISTTETNITNLETEVANLETDIPNLENQVVSTTNELNTTIEDVKPGVGVDTGWETVSLDVNQDGVIDSNDLL